MLLVKNAEKEFDLCLTVIVFLLNLCRYYPEIFNKSGGWDNVAKYGDWFTYDKSPRAQIFKRDQSKVIDLVAMQKLMRYCVNENNLVKSSLCSN